MDDTINAQFRVDLPQTVLPEIGTFLSSMRFADFKYYVSFEKGTKSGKDHCQGWVTFSGKIDTYRKKCTEWAKKKGLDGKKKQFCFGVIRDHPTYCAYIMNNTEKGYIDHVTNISVLDLNSLKEAAPEFVSKEEYTKTGKKKGYDFTLAIIQGYEDLLAERCERGDTGVIEDPLVDVLEYTIRYFAQNTKVHDQIIIKRFVYLLLGKFYPAQHKYYLFNPILDQIRKRE